MSAIDATSSQEVRVQIEGMSCASCVGKIESGLSALAGVQQVQIQLASDQGTVRFDPHQITEDTLLEHFRRLGYPAQRVTLQTGVAHASATPIHQNLWQWLQHRDWAFALVGALFLMANMALGLPRMIDFGIAALNQFVFGYRFLKGFLRDLRTWSFGMDTLIAVGSLSAFGLSAVFLWVPDFFHNHHGHSYFEVGSFVIAFVLLGKSLEKNARHRTQDALIALAALTPKTTWVKKDGQTTEVSIESVAVGDALWIRKGDSIPVDGLLLRTEAWIDESALTGEANPVHKQNKDKVFAGTLNAGEAFTYYATEIGEKTLLAKILKLVEAAQNSKPAIQKATDRIASIFVPWVLGLSALTVVVWIFIFHSSLPEALQHGIAVLVIACPCALGLATPTAVITGIGRAAQLGILIRNAEALEVLGKAKTFLFDKTGTLTEGKPQVVHVEWQTNLSEEQRNNLLRLLGQLEANSQHPLAQAIARHTQQESHPLPQTRVIPGKGMIYESQSTPTSSFPGNYTQLIAGSRAFLLESGIPEKEFTTFGPTNLGSYVYLAANHRLTAVVQLRDVLRPYAQQLFRELQARGVQTRILSGDQSAAVAALAHELGVDAFEAGLLPQQKLEKIQELHKQPELTPLVMVGDGINDAPALAAADTSITLGGASGAAIQSSGIVLLQDRLEKVVTAFDLSRATLAIIYQNLFLSFAYNVLAIPLAAGFLKPWLALELNPMIASGTMALSSITVVLNSLRLKKWSPNHAKK